MENFVPPPMEIPKLAFSYKLGQKHRHSDIFCSLVIPKDPDTPDGLASGILTQRTLK